MEQTTELDSENAFIQVRRAIKSLLEFGGEDDLDDVIYTANKLAFVLRTVHDNRHAWNDEAIREFVLAKNDPLKHIDAKSDRFSYMVRKIQQEMIVKFS